MTLSTVGYGDVLPQTDGEYILNVCIMFFGCFIWAWVVGSLTGMIAMLDRHGTNYKNISDGEMVGDGGR